MKKSTIRRIILIVWTSIGILLLIGVTLASKGDNVVLQNNMSNIVEVYAGGSVILACIGVWLK